MERPSRYDAKDPRLGMCWEAVMIGITVYVHVSTERSSDRSPDMHVIWLEERAKGPILHVPPPDVATPSSPIKKQNKKNVV